MTGVTSPTGDRWVLGSTNDQKIERFEGDLAECERLLTAARAETNDITAKELLSKRSAAWTRAYRRSSPGTTTTRRRPRASANEPRRFVPRTRAKRRVPRGRGVAREGGGTPRGGERGRPESARRPTGERGEAEGHRGPNPRPRAARQTRAGRGLAAFSGDKKGSSPSCLRKPSRASAHRCPRCTKRRTVCSAPWTNAPAKPCARSRTRGGRPSWCCSSTR